ncbi:MAG: dihydropteroate synthase [Clostridia bacterium]|nr:dihydropteroate synthase [Clostridia bacterium]
MIFSGNNFKFELGKKTYIMGILNVTSDSFYDGGKYNTPEKAVTRAREMLCEGADIIDIGAHSTRPNHTVLTEDEELEIIKNYLPLIYNETKAVISVDTFYPAVAEYALKNGASIINDVSGTFNEEIAKLVVQYNCGWVLMHTGGGDSVTVPEYSTTVTDDVVVFFAEMLKKCTDYGINKNQLCFDMGIGFGKSHEQNVELIKNIDKLKQKDIAFLTALSMKRVVKNTTNAEGDDLLYGTISANTLAIKGGTDIIRVHNVKENVLAVKMTDAVVRG